MVLEPGLLNSRFDTRLIYISVKRVQVKDLELTAKSVPGLADIGLYTRLMTVINIDIDKVSGFPDIGFTVYLLHRD